jgi:hypothetical protein
MIEIALGVVIINGAPVLYYPNKANVQILIIISSKASGQTFVAYRYRPRVTKESIAINMVWIIRTRSVSKLLSPYKKEIVRMNHAKDSLNKLEYSIAHLYQDKLTLYS